MDGEEWRDIAGYEGIYQASSLGRIRSLDRLVGCGGGFKLHRGRVRRLGDNKGTGYLGITLSVDGKSRSRDVHRVIAETFIPNPNGLPCVDHIDADRHNNRVDNLRWVTQRENVRHSIELGRYDMEKRIECLLSKRTRENKLAALRHPLTRSDGRTFKSVTEAAEETKCSRRAITLVLSGTNKTAKGYSFAYA